MSDWIFTFYITNKYVENKGYDYTYYIYMYIYVYIAFSLDVWCVAIKVQEWKCVM